MANVAMLYDRSETDELGIRLTAEQMGIELEFLPFHKVAVAFDSRGHSYRSLGRDFTDDLDEVRVVLNRTQSKHRRLVATMILEAFGKTVLNPLPVELACQSKVQTLLLFAKRGILVPRTVFVPSNVEEHVAGGGVKDYSGTVSRLISQELGEERVVVKPDAGTHGTGVSLAEGRDGLMEALRAVTPSIINPVGVVAQELIPKWFYDLRILVRKEKGKPPRCHETALARGGFKEFRTNTFLGNKVVRAQLPPSVMREAERCGEALGGGRDAWVIALDAMPRIGEDLREGEEELRRSFDELEGPFSEVTRVKRMPRKKQDFPEYTREINRAYSEYMASEAYAHIEGVVNETLEKTQDSIYFHEGNACPEFWEQTRIVGGVNLAEDLLACAQSLIDA